MWFLLRRHQKVHLPPSDVGLNNFEHVQCGLVQLDEHTVVDLPQTEELKDLPWLRVESIDTKNKLKAFCRFFINYIRSRHYQPSDPDDKCNLWLRGNVEVSIVTSLPRERQLLLLSSLIFLGVLFGPHEIFFLPQNEFLKSVLIWDTCSGGEIFSRLIKHL